MLAIIGLGSKIAQDLTTTVDDEIVYPIGELNFEADRYLFCIGTLHGKTLIDHNAETVAETMYDNYYTVALACDKLLARNSKVRICVIGSDSGYRGSYDMAYAGAKAALHLYIETKKLQPAQQLVGIAPSIIEDCGMTLRRTDLDNLMIRKVQHPKRRFLKAVEVARLAKFLLYTDEGYITNTVIRMNGGER